MPKGPQGQQRPAGVIGNASRATRQGWEIGSSGEARGSDGEHPG